MKRTTKNSQLHRQLNAEKLAVMKQLEEPGKLPSLGKVFKQVVSTLILGAAGSALWEGFKNFMGW